MPSFLITCATGRQGTSTARHLLAQGAQVHALVRDPASPAAIVLQTMGATLFKGGLDDVPAITAAMQDVSGVFLITIRSSADANYEAHVAETFVAAAQAAGTIKSFVVSTAYQTDQRADWDEMEADFPFLAHYYSSKAGVEKVIRASGFTYTILRPGWLMHNYIAPGPAYHFPEYMSERVLTVSCPRDWRMEHLDAADVGKFAAAALLNPVRFSGKELNLINEWLTFEEIAAHLSEAAGLEIKVKYRTAEETAKIIKVHPPIERQIWAPTIAPANASELAEYGFRLTTLKEFLEREKSAIRKTVGIEI